MSIASTRRFIDHYLRGMERRRELIPGGREALLEMVDHRDPGEALQGLHRYLFGDGDAPGEGAGFLTPRAKDSTAPEHPIHATLRRFAHLKAGAADALFTEWAASLVTKKPDQAVREIARRLTAPENRRHLAEVDLSPQEQTAREALKPYRHLFRREIDLDELVAQPDWYGLAVQGRPHEVRRIVARRLATPSWAEKLLRDGEPIEFDPHDPGFQPTAEEEARLVPVRQELREKGLANI